MSTSCCGLGSDPTPQLKCDRCHGKVHIRCYDLDDDVPNTPWTCDPCADQIDKFECELCRLIWRADQTFQPIMIRSKDQYVHVICVATKTRRVCSALGSRCSHCHEMIGDMMRCSEGECVYSHASCALSSGDIIIDENNHPIFLCKSHRESAHKDTGDGGDPVRPIRRRSRGRDLKIIPVDSDEVNTGPGRRTKKIVSKRGVRKSQSFSDNETLRTERARLGSRGRYSTGMVKKRKRLEKEDSDNRSLNRRSRTRHSLPSREMLKIFQTEDDGDDFEALRRGLTRSKRFKVT